MTVLTWSGCSTSGYGLLPRFVLPSVNTIKMFALSLRSPPALVNSFWAAISKALSVRVHCPGYLISITRFFSSTTSWYFGFAKSNSKLELVLYVITPKCVALMETEKWDIKDWTNSLAILKLFLPTLPEPSRMMPTSKALVQAKFNCKIKTFLPQVHVTYLVSYKTMVPPSIFSNGSL